MNKKFIITKNEDINKMIENCKSKKTKYFVIYFNDNKLNYNRYCITVGKKNAKANVRNKVKRQIKDILMKNTLNNSKDYVIIVRKQVLYLKYEEIKKEVLNLIKEIG